MSVIKFIDYGRLMRLHYLVMKITTIFLQKHIMLGDLILCPLLINSWTPNHCHKNKMSTKFHYSTHRSHTDLLICTPRKCAYSHYNGAFMLNLKLFASFHCLLCKFGSWGIRYFHIYVGASLTRYPVLTLNDYVLLFYQTSFVILNVFSLKPTLFM